MNNYQQNIPYCSRYSVHTCTIHVRHEKLHIRFVLVAQAMWRRWAVSIECRLHAFRPSTLISSFALECSLVKGFVLCKMDRFN